VPIYIRAGKMLPVTCTEATVEFKRPPRETYGELVPVNSAHMRIRVSTEFSIGLGVRVKIPGERMVGRDVELDLHSQPVDEMPPYERLLGDASRGNVELFSRQDLVEAQWRVVEPILGNVTPVYSYLPGTWGPEEAGQLISNDGPWIDPVVEDKKPC
jgi:glucose-6-phosphate 1-dehydrogenase